MTLEGNCGGLTDFGCDDLLLQEEGVTVGRTGTLNFIGAGVTATISNGIGNITITGTGSGGGGSGTVTNVSVVSANGFKGAVANPTTTPAITIDVSGLSTSKISGGAFGRSFFAVATTAAAQSLLNQTNGTVTNLTFVSANGFAASISNPTTTPAITLRVSALDASKIADGSISNAEFQRLDGVTSNIQTQFSTKQPNIQFQDEGIDIGTSGGISTINFTGPSVVASATGGVLTVRCSAAGGGSSGTVESVSIVSANGFFGTVASATTTPKITIDVSGLSTSKIAGGAFGRSFFATATTAAAHNALAAGATGLLVYQAATTAAIQSIIDASAKQNIIQFQDEGSNVGTAGGINTVNFTGAQVDTSATGSTLTVRVSATGGSGSPGGADTNVQYNDGGVFGGDANFIWNKTTRTLTINTSSATGFNVGTNGATNPTLVVNSNTAGADNGLTITGGTGDVTLAVTGNDANSSFNINSKGTGDVVINSPSTGQIALQNNTASRFVIAAGRSFAFTPATLGTASTVRFSYVGAADTGLTAAAEAPNWYINLGQTRQHTAGAVISLQRDIRISPTNHSCTVSSNLADVACFSIDGPGNAGTSAVITNAHALYIPTKALTGTIANAYSVNVAAPTGATNNFAARFGNVFIDGADAIYGFQTKINDQSSSYTLVSADSGQTIKINSATSASLNLPKEMPKGFTVEVIAYSSGAVVFVPASGATLENRQGHTKIAGQFGAVRLVVVSNSAGTNAFYNLAGDTAA
jgi:hypothetical protein